MKKTLVKVYWRDIAGLSCDDGEAAWLSEEALMRNAERMYKTEYISVGYLIGKTKKYIVIAATDGKGNWADASMIMKSVIIKIKKLN